MLLGELAIILTALLCLSVVAFVGGLLVLPIVAVRIPADYFVRRELPKGMWQGKHPVWRFTGVVLKNVLGAALITAGVIMLVTPGPGVVGILVGLWLVDLPGKRAAERRIICQHSVHTAINKLRVRYGREPLQLPVD